MRRIKLVLAALTLVVATFTAFSGPAMADNLNCHDSFGNLIRCDGRFFAPVSNFDNGFFFVNGFNTFPFFNNFNNFENCRLFLPAVTIC
jgi:hypothetical protein